MRETSTQIRRIQAPKELFNESKGTLDMVWRDLPLITFISVMLVVLSKALAGGV